MYKIFISFLLLFTCLASLAQNSETVYLDASDSSSNLYVTVTPTLKPFKGLLVLVPGMFQKAADVLIQTDLPKYAAQKGLLTIIPTFKNGVGAFGIDSVTQFSLLELLQHLNKQYPVQGLPLYLGGFSIGGSCAIKYAELAKANNYKIKPAAVFAIDAPLDFERMYRNMLRETRLPNSDPAAVEESKYMLKYFLQELGGTPDEAPDQYEKISPYLFRDTTQRAIRLLLGTPVRLYTEPDVEFWLKMGVDYSLMNAFDLAAFYNELLRLGHSNISLILTTNKGYRQPGNVRFPHAWSIAEPAELVKWLMTQK